jgi:hypothetical protein
MIKAIARLAAPSVRRSRLSLCPIRATVNRLSGSHQGSFVKKFVDIFDEADQYDDGRTEHPDEKEDAQSVHEKRNYGCACHTLILYVPGFFLLKIC